MDQTVNETLNESVARRLLEHLRNDTTDMSPEILDVPVENFVSEARARAERDLLRRVPVVVAHHTEIEPGGFITRMILDTPLLLVREPDGVVHGYLNMCRHRGGRVEMEASGSKRLFMCQYHGWTYDRDGGTLRNVPFEQYFGDVDKACNSLIPVKVEERHGLVWVNLSNEPAQSVAEFLGEAAEAQLRVFDMDNSVVVIDETFDLDVNWKLVMDGANDVLHLKFLHPNGVGKLIVTNTSAFESYGRCGQQFSPRKRMEELAKAGGEVDHMWRYIGSNLRLYPNSMVIAAPDHVEFWTVWPHEDPNKSTTNIRFFVSPEILTDDMRSRMRRSYDILMEAALAEDWPMEVSIQENSRAYPQGMFRYGRNELSIQHFHANLEQDLGRTTPA